MTRQIPMLFSPEMMRAHLDGRKTETRRVLKISGYRGFYDFGRSDTKGYDWHFRRSDGVWCDFRHDDLLKLLPVHPGDLIWARETHYRTDDGDSECVVYVADEEEARQHLEDIERLKNLYEFSDEWAANHTKKRPSIHMPKWASRLTLRVKEVAVERLQDITEDDAIVEGVIPHMGGWKAHAGTIDYPTAVWAYRHLWGDINGPDAWNANPWVTVTRYEPIWQNVLEVAG